MRPPRSGSRAPPPSSTGAWPVSRPGGCSRCRRPPTAALARRKQGAARGRGREGGSPFADPRQGQLYVAADLPDPSRHAGAWQDAVDELCDQLVEAAGGRTLALFTSSAAASRAAAAVRAATDVPVLLQ